MGYRGTWFSRMFAKPCADVQSAKGFSLTRPKLMSNSILAALRRWGVCPYECR